MVEEAKWKSVTEGVGQLLSMKDGVAIIKAFDQGANGKWKWAKQPGNGRTRAVFTCNNHSVGWRLSPSVYGKTTRRCCAVPAVRRLRCGACGAVPAVRNGAVRHDGAPHGGHVLGERSSRTHSTD